MINPSIIIFALGLLTYIPIVKAITISEVMQLAIEHNQAIKAAQLQLSAQQELRPQAISAFLPQVSAQAQEGRLHVTQHNPRPTSINNLLPPPQTSLNETLIERFAEVSATLNIFAGGQDIANLNLADAQINAQIAELVAVEQMTLSQALLAYANIYYFGKQAQTFEAQIRYLYNLESQLEEMLTHENMTISDVAQITNQAAQVDVIYQSIIAQRDAAIGQLIAIIGPYDGIIEEIPKLNGLPDNVETILELSDQDNPFLQQAGYQIDIGQSQTDIARGIFFPQIDLTSSALWEFEKSNFTNINDFNTHQRQSNYSVALQLSVPLYTGGFLRSQLRENRDLTQAAQFQYNDAARQLIAMVQANWAQLNASRLQIKATQREIKSADTALEGQLRQFREGTLSTQDLIIAQQLKYQAQIDHDTSLFNEFSAVVNLMAGMAAISISS